MYRIILPTVLLVAVITLTEPINAEPDRAQGKALFERHCAACHGENGDGSGEAERYLVPKARDFTAGVYKFRSTPSGTPPTDEDLYRTVKTGIPGTSMPSFARLSDDELASVIAHVKSYSDIFEDEDAIEPPISIGKAARSSAKSIAAGEQTYQNMECNKCHGEGGQGDGPSSGKLTDDWDQPITPYDLTRGPMLMKGGASSQSIYRTFMTGLDGTPMPSYMDELAEADRWPLVHYIQSLSDTSDSDVADTQSVPTTLTVKKTRKKIPLDLNSRMWRRIKPQTVSLRPIRARNIWPDKVGIKIVRNGTHIAFRFTWQDNEANNKLVAATDFIDGVALQFVNTDMPNDYIGIPFFGMGDQADKVDIWYWKAAVSGRGRHGPVNDDSAVSVLEANGFGTLEDQSEAAQIVEGIGTYKDGTWTVVMRQKLDASAFKTRKSIPVAIAVWDGSERDRAGQKSVSEWFELKLN